MTLRLCASLLVAQMLLRCSRWYSRRVSLRP